MFHAINPFFLPRLHRKVQFPKLVWLAIPWYSFTCSETSLLLTVALTYIRTAVESRSECGDNLDLIFSGSTNRSRKQ
jgi:hypothetical protein